MSHCLILLHPTVTHVVHSTHPVGPYASQQRRHEAAETLFSNTPQVEQVTEHSEKTQQELEGKFSSELESRSQEIQKYRDLIKYVEGRYNAILSEEEVDRDVEVGGLCSTRMGSVRFCVTKRGAVTKRGIILSGYPPTIAA